METIIVTLFVAMTIGGQDIERHEQVKSLTECWDRAQMRMAEMMASRPEIVTRKIDDQVMEPVEHLSIDVPENFVGTVIERLGPRKGEMTKMVNHGSGRVRMEFRIPSRGLIGLRSEMLTETRGTIVMNAILDGHIAYQGEIPQRTTGAIVADRQGVTTPYALEGIQERGMLFVPEGTEVYEGMIIGEHSRDNDIDVNCVREKQTPVVSGESAKRALDLAFEITRQIQNQQP